MTADPYLELPPVKRRRLVYAAALRGVLTATVLLVLYYVLPFDTWSGDTALRLLAGLVIFIGVTVWQIRSIAGARYPGLKAAEVLGLVLPLYLVVFASTYYVMERTSVATFSEPLTRTGALYFTVTVFSTVGFGDIVARTDVARLVVVVQMLGDLALLGAGARLLLGAVRRGRARQTNAGDGSGSDA
jgi:voltage-gated potassium channel